MLSFILPKNECLFALIANHADVSGGTEDEVETDTITEAHRLCLAPMTQTDTS